MSGALPPASAAAAAAAASKAAATAAAAAAATAAATAAAASQPQRPPPPPFPPIHPSFLSRPRCLHSSIPLHVAAAGPGPPTATTDRRTLHPLPAPTAQFPQPALHAFAAHMLPLPLLPGSCCSAVAGQPGGGVHTGGRLGGCCWRSLARLPCATPPCGTHPHTFAHWHGLGGCMQLCATCVGGRRTFAEQRGGVKSTSWLGWECTRFEGPD